MTAAPTETLAGDIADLTALLMTGEGKVTS